MFCPVFNGNAFFRYTRVSQWQLRLFKETFEIDSFWSKKSFLFAFAKGQTSNHFETSTIQGGGSLTFASPLAAKCRTMASSYHLQRDYDYMHGK